MARLDRRYPGYGWAENAGYGTAIHRAGLHQLGITAHHRAGFGTVRRLVLANSAVDAATIDVA
jgi:ribonuclease HII